MVRFLINLFLLCAVAIAISLQDGVVHLQRGDTSIDLDLQTALALLALAFVWWWGIAKIWFFIKYGFSRRHEKLQRRRTEEGVRSLTLAVNALAGGDVRAATKHTRRARRLLGEVPLAVWLEAALAQRRGDAKGANTFYRQLASTPEGAVLGWRGLLQQQSRTDSAAILQLTHDALAIDAINSHDFAHELRIMAFARQNDWVGAMAALQAAQRVKAISKPRAVVLESVITMQQGQILADKESALKHLRLAHKLQPAMVPVALAYAKMLVQQNDRSLANKVIAGLWLVQPHGDTLALYQSINSSDALAALQGFEKFALKRKDHAETHIGMAQLCLAANVTGKARTHAEQAVAITPCQQSYLTLADVQVAEGQPVTATHDAIAAAPIGLYVCEACSRTGTAWDAVCPSCGKVATLQWYEDVDNLSLPISTSVLLG